MHYNRIQPFTFWFLAAGPSVERADSTPNNSETREYDLSGRI
jgi:hypothetical protein